MLALTKVKTGLGYAGAVQETVPRHNATVVGGEGLKLAKLDE
jgi:hypothetical protein